MPESATSSRSPELAVYEGAGDVWGVLQPPPCPLNKNIRFTLRWKLELVYFGLLHKTRKLSPGKENGPVVNELDEAGANGASAVN